MLSLYCPYSVYSCYILLYYMTTWKMTFDCWRPIKCPSSKILATLKRWPLAPMFDLGKSHAGSGSTYLPRTWSREKTANLISNYISFISFLAGQKNEWLILEPQLILSYISCMLEGNGRNKKHKRRTCYPIYRSVIIFSCLMSFAEKNNE